MGERELLWIEHVLRISLLDLNALSDSQKDFQVIVVQQ